MLSIGPLRRAQSGFSLIEVLITLFIFAVGLLGVGGLQVVSKKSTYDAVQRTGAAMLASETLERMRANGSVLDQYLGSIPAGAVPAPAVDCEAVDCDSAALAAFDLWLVSEAAAGVQEIGAGDVAGGGLVDATLCIAGPADGSSGFYEVAVVWRGRGAMPDRAAHLCGAGRYGDGDEYRRLLMFTTFIEAS